MRCLCILFLLAHSTLFYSILFYSILLFLDWEGKTTRMMHCCAFRTRLMRCTKVHALMTTRRTSPVSGTSTLRTSDYCSRQQVGYWRKWISLKRIWFLSNLISHHIISVHHTHRLDRWPSSHFISSNQGKRQRDSLTKRQTSCWEIVSPSTPE